MSTTTRSDTSGLTIKYQPHTTRNNSFRLEVDVGRGPLGRMVSTGTVSQQDIEYAILAARSSLENSYQGKQLTEDDIKDLPLAVRLAIKKELVDRSIEVTLPSPVFFDFDELQETEDRERQEAQERRERSCSSWGSRML